MTKPLGENKTFIPTGATDAQLVEKRQGDNTAGQQRRAELSVDPSAVRLEVNDPRANNQFTVAITEEVAGRLKILLGESTNSLPSADIILRLILAIRLENNDAMKPITVSEICGRIGNARTPATLRSMISKLTFPSDICVEWSTDDPESFCLVQRTPMMSMLQQLAGEVIFRINNQNPAKRKLVQKFIELLLERHIEGGLVTKEDLEPELAGVHPKHFKEIVTEVTKVVSFLQEDGVSFDCDEEAGSYTIIDPSGALKTRLTTVPPDPFVTPSGEDSSSSGQ